MNAPRTTLALPTLVLLAATRALLGAGVALLAEERLAPRTRRNLGFALVGIGVLSTVPLLFAVFRGRARGIGPEAKNIAWAA